MSKSIFAPNFSLISHITTARSPSCASTCACTCLVRSLPLLVVPRWSCMRDSSPGGTEMGMTLYDEPVNVPWGTSSSSPGFEQQQHQDIFCAV
eukprot:m.35104 g.35104  ORF g.35104 m.35104 type:complete len:93 (-) comp11244_c0_seq1:149-427(-)